MPMHCIFGPISQSAYFVEVKIIRRRWWREGLSHMCVCERERERERERKERERESTAG